MSDIILNDFISFKHFLFGKDINHCNWNRFLGYRREKMGFVPPINSPETIEEYQLNHYAYWMCISVFSPTNKILFLDGMMPPLHHCYACEYSRTLPCCLDQCTTCPLKDRITNGVFRCILPYEVWWRISGKRQSSSLAREIATWPWIKPDPSRENI